MIADFDTKPDLTTLLPGQRCVQVNGAPAVVLPDGSTSIDTRHSLKLKLAGAGTIRLHARQYAIIPAAEANRLASDGEVTIILS